MRKPILHPQYFGSIVDAYRLGRIYSQMCPTRKFFIFSNRPGVTLVTNRWHRSAAERLGFYLNGIWTVDCNLPAK